MKPAAAERSAWLLRWARRWPAAPAAAAEPPAWAELVQDPAARLQDALVRWTGAQAPDGAAPQRGSSGPSHAGRRTAVPERSRAAMAMPQAVAPAARPLLHDPAAARMPTPFGEPAIPLAPPAAAAARPLVPSGLEGAAASLGRPVAAAAVWPAPAGAAHAAASLAEPEAARSNPDDDPPSGPTRLAQGAGGLGRLLSLVPLHRAAPSTPAGSAGDGASRPQARASADPAWIARAPDPRAVDEPAFARDPRAWQPAASGPPRQAPATPAEAAPPSHRMSPAAASGGAPTPSLTMIESPAAAPDLDALLEALADQLEIEYLRCYGSAA